MNNAPMMKPFNFSVALAVVVAHVLLGWAISVWQLATPVIRLTDSPSQPELPAAAANVLAVVVKAEILKAPAVLAPALNQTLPAKPSTAGPADVMPPQALLDKPSPPAPPGRTSFTSSRSVSRCRSTMLAW